MVGGTGLEHFERGVGALLSERKAKTMEKSGRRGRNRTCNRRIRNPMLYPFELRAHFLIQL